jgi:CPA1 family monovalent cation:H+ antiporter
VVDVAVVTLAIAGLLALISLVQPLAERLRLPQSVLLAVLGVAIGVASSVLLNTSFTNRFDIVAEPFVHLPVNAATFLVVFLPLLLFQASLTIDLRELVEDAAPILTLAIVAVLVAAAAVGFSLSLAGVPLISALMLGAIVATTDPAAVIAMFRELGTPGRLTRLVEGESLLNDAAAIVLFTMLLEMSTGQGTPELIAGVGHFLVEFIGGVAFGLFAARLFALALPLLGGLRSAEATLSLALPYLVYLLGERMLGVSGVVAVVAAGLGVGVGSRARLSPENWTYLQNVWEQIGYWAGSLVFVLASILVPKLMVDVDLHDLGLLLVVVVAAFLARALVLFGLLPLLSALRLSQKVSNAYKLALTWGGLRGAVTLALALAVTENAMLDPQVKRLVAVLATGFVLFTLLVNGLTLRPMVRLLKLDQLSPLNQALRNKVLALSLADMRDGIFETAKTYEIGPAVARAVVRPYETRIQEIAAEPALEEAISDRDRITIGLAALANRERQLIIDHHAQRTVSPPVIERLLRNTTHMLDGAKTEGRVGYNRAAREILGYHFGFKLAHLLHRRLGWDRLLVREISARFEALVVRRLALEELRRFIPRRLRPLLEERVAGMLGEVIAARVEATSRALDALRLQYPEHAEALERRFLKQSALRKELALYRDLYGEGLIGAELFDNLRREHEDGRRRAEQRPPLDLGLRSEDLLRRFDMFKGLDNEQLRALSRLFRPRLAVPEEVIIRRGTRGDSAYFISSGAVEVMLPNQKVRLGRSDFFGEMALLTGHRRQADVIALTYCQLLVLNGADFQRFLKSNPSAKAEIDRVMEARIRMNQGSGAAAPEGDG